jgi:hypothetical protein
MGKVIFLTAVLLAAGCASEPKAITTPNGKQGFYVSCSRGFEDWATCYSAATKMCGGAYNVVDRRENSTPTQWGPAVTRYIVAECRT